MTIEDCYLDTTIVVEALLKKKRRRREAIGAIRAYRRSFLPVYAIKEMSVGALSHFIWLHNRLLQTKSFSKTLQSLVSNMRRPNRVSTCLEAIQAADESITGSMLSPAQTSIELDRMKADMIALSLRRIILKGWQGRRTIATGVVDELNCFPEEAPFFDEQLQILDVENKSCPTRTDCHYAPGLRRRKQELVALIKAIEGQTRPEDTRRRAALHVLANVPKKEFDNKQCRALGDAYFALHCPEGATILTSNAKDHEPLAAALHKSVTEYRWSAG